MAKFEIPERKVRKFNVGEMGSDWGKWTVSTRKDNTIRWAFFIWLAFFLIGAGVLGWFFDRIPAEVPMFFSRPWGEPELAAKGFLWLLPVGNLMLALVNFGFGNSFHDREAFISRVLFWTTALVAVLTTLSIVNILLLMQ